MNHDIARIRLISNDSSILLSLNEILTRGAFEVSVSLDAEDALSFLLQNPPDLVILDYQGHDSDALDWLHQIRECSPGIRVILLANRTDWAFYEEVQKRGGDLLSPRKHLRPLHVLHAVERALQGTSP